LRLLVNSSWLRTHVPAMNTMRVERAGSFDPPRDAPALQARTPCVPFAKCATVIGRPADGDPSVPPGNSAIPTTSPWLLMSNAIAPTVSVGCSNR
jgi:hypothetical protein